MRLTLTLALAAAIVGVIWQKLGPRLEDLPDSAVKPKPLDPTFVRLTPRETATLPLATRFDMPLGSEHGAFTYNARAFRIERHLGDDLNGIGGYNSDLGDPVYAAAAGRVVFAGVPGQGWGNMVILAHRVRNAETGELDVVQSMYAHLDKVHVLPDQVLCLLVDGVPATQPDGQGQISQLNLATADRIEVLRGPFSALYGNSSGGVIQLFTADAAASPELQLTGFLGGYGDRRLSAVASGLGATVGYTDFRTEGYRPHSAAQRGSLNAKVDHRVLGGKLTLLLNHLEAPDALDQLGLTRAQFDAPFGFAGGAVVEVGFADRAILQRRKRTGGGREDRLLPFEQQAAEIILLRLVHVWLCIGREIVAGHGPAGFGQHVDFITQHTSHSALQAAALALRNAVSPANGRSRHPVGAPIGKCPNPHKVFLSGRRIVVPGSDIRAVFLRVNHLLTMFGDFVPAWASRMAAPRDRGRIDDTDLDQAGFRGRGFCR